MKKTIIIAVLLIIINIQFSCAQKQTTEGQKPLTVFLVRHAEKFGKTKDPELSDIGKERALDLVKTLRSANIEYVHSSDFIRTRETAKPIAEKFGLTTEIYNPFDLEALALKLKNKGGNHLVVGHSNTTPEMVRLLGGNSVSDINEKSEYDRLYIIQISSKNEVSSVLMRYGTSYIEKPK